MTTPGERPMMRDSLLVVVPMLLAAAALVAGIVVGFARVESLVDLVWNPRWSPWLWLPLGLAALASAIAVVPAVLARYWIPELTSICILAVVAAAAAFSVAIVTLLAIAHVVRARHAMRG